MFKLFHLFCMFVCYVCGGRVTFSMLRSECDTGYLPLSLCLWQWDKVSPWTGSLLFQSPTSSYLGSACFCPLVLGLQAHEAVFQLFYFMYMDLSKIRLCAKCMPIDYGGQKRTTDPLELELQMVVSCHVDAWN